MSTSNGAAPRTIRPADIVGAFAALPRRMGGNLGRWIGTLASPPKVQLRAWPASAPIVIALVVAAIVASMFLLDARASDWALHLPHWLTRFADQITNFGLSGWFLYPLALFLLFLAAVTRSWLPAATQETLALLVARAGFLFIAIALPGLFVTIVKRLIGRARPYVGPHDNPFHFTPFVWRSDYASMPSGHAATVAAAAFAIGAIWPRARGVMWLYALIIMGSRVVIDVHHPSDVVAGALVGVVGALAVRRWFAARQIAFSPADLRALPGPSWRQLADAARSIVRGKAAAAN